MVGNRPHVSKSPEEKAVARPSPELLIRTHRIADLVTLDVAGSGTRAASAYRETYLRRVEGHDGTPAVRLLERHFQTHPFDDPYVFATRMSRDVILGVYADSDGTLIRRRTGYDSSSLFSPRLAAAISRTIEKTGLFTIASAAHIWRAIALLRKARRQVPLERVLFFAENGYAAIIPVKTGDDFEFEIHRALIPEFATSTNRAILKALDKLSEVALDWGLFMFVNHDKEAKITLELMKNGKDVNSKIVSRLVIPYLMKEMRLPGAALRATEDALSLELPRLTYSFTPTCNSVEIDHDYLASKRTVSAISNDLVRRLWLQAFGNKDQIYGNRVFIGLGDSPSDSDQGLLDPTYGNVGVCVRDQSRTLKNGETLLHAIIEDADSPFITLPVFSEDGGVQYGDGDAAAANLDRLFFTGTIFRVKDLGEMRASLRTVLREARYLRTKDDVAQGPDEMYSLPGYLAKRKEARALMKRFLSSEVADAGVERKIAIVATRLGI